MTAVETAAGPGLGVTRARLRPLQIAGLLIVLAALIVAVWPLGLSNDYLNHLARNHIEARIWFDADLQRYYDLSFSVIPDLTMDMIVPLLSHSIGIYGAGAVMIWVALVAAPVAGLLIARNLHGRVTWCALLGFLAVFNENMQLGLVNFSASTGLALLGFALWMNARHDWRRTLVFAPFGAFLALNHALGFLLFGYLVLLWEIGCFARGERGAIRVFLRQLLSKDAVAMAPGLVLLLLSTVHASELPVVVVPDNHLLAKLAGLWAGSAFFNPALASLVAVALASAVFLGLRRGLLSIDPRMVPVCLGMLLLIVLIPVSLFGIWGLHFRYSGVLVILAAASLRVSPDAGHRIARPAMQAAAALVCAVFANGAWQMAENDRQSRALRTVLAAVEPGSRVLPARHAEADLAFAGHSVAMAVIEKSAYVPNLFTNTSPVDVRPEMKALHMPQSWPVLRQELEGARRNGLPTPENGHWSSSFFYAWPKNWDYVLYFRAAANQSLDIAGLCPVAEAENLVLYDVVENRCDGGGQAS